MMVEQTRIYKKVQRKPPQFPLFTVSVSFCLVVIHKKVRTSEVSAAQFFLQPFREGVWKGTELSKERHQA